MQTMPLAVLLSSLLFGQTIDSGTPADRGVVHEAYAQVAQGAPPADNMLIPRQPPDPLAEEPPDTKPDGDGVIWIGGYWHYDDLRDDFIWVSGFWRQAPPGRRWVPGRFSRPGVGTRWQWQSGYWQGVDGGPGLVVTDAPPPVPEAGPSVPAPAVNMFWSPGCQVWRANRWVWRAGSWMNHRPGWVWYPATWMWTPGGYVFIPGYWDYALEYRGLLYAPVYYRPAVWRDRHFCHRPRVLVCQDDLACGLFRRNGCGSYYYGNFFGVQLAGRGFSFWIGGNAGPVGGVGVAHAHRVDPLAGYYRHHREEAWVRAVEGYGRQRAEGRSVAPPQQITLVDNRVTVLNNTVGNAGLPTKVQPGAVQPRGTKEDVPANRTAPAQPRGEGVRLVAAQDLPRTDLRSRHAPPKEILREERVPERDRDLPKASRSVPVGASNSPAAPSEKKVEPATKAPASDLKPGPVGRPLESTGPRQRPVNPQPGKAGGPDGPKEGPALTNPGKGPAPARQPAQDRPKDSPAGVTPAKVPAPAKQPAPSAGPTNPGPRQEAVGSVERGTAERGNTAPRVARGAAPEMKVPIPAPTAAGKAVEGMQRVQPTVPAAKSASVKERQDSRGKGEGRKEPSR